MFSGIIEGMGMVKTLTLRNGETQLEIQADFSLAACNVGDSIAVNGCCLTMTSRLGNTFWADVSEETLRVTTLGRFRVGSCVNLEQPLCYGGRVGGHLVQGHVDGIGRVIDRLVHDGSVEFVIDIPLQLARYVIAKGSIAVDGVSLTIAQVVGTAIHLWIIPHTEQVTTFHHLQPNDMVNLEADMMAKYLEKLAFLPSETYHSDTRLGEAFRRKFGFS